MSRRDVRSRARRVRSARITQWTAVAVAVGVVLTGGVAVLVQQQAESPQSIADCDRTYAETPEEAGAIASECGIDVEVRGERTPWEVTYVTADGRGRVDATIMPSATNVNGSWEPLNNTIFAEAADGMLDVAAPLYDMSLTSGGEGAESRPLGVIEHDGHRLEMWFPLDLPEGEVDGDQITYQLRSDVRLTTTIREDGSGFVPVLVLDSPSAADWLEEELSQARQAKGLPGSSRIAIRPSHRAWCGNSRAWRRSAIWMAVM